MRESCPTMSEVKSKNVNKRPTYYDTINSWFKEFTGYELKNVSSFEEINQLLHSPRDGSSLAVARICFGESR